MYDSNSKHTIQTSVRRMHSLGFNQNWKFERESDLVMSNEMPEPLSSE